MGWGRSSRAALAAAAVTLLACARAGADGTARVVAAEELFHAGRALIAGHKYREACEKLQSSQRLDPAVGTLLSLGECYMGQGKTASAWLSYQRAVALANQRRDPRSKAAEERAAAVEPLLSRLVLSAGTGARGPDVQITVNGETLEAGVLLEPVPIDPGLATIEASAPGFRTWSMRATIGPLGDRVTVVIPPLERLPAPGELATEEASVRARRTAGLALGGTGLATLGVGAIVGLQAIVKIRDANRSCPGLTTCNDVNAVRENGSGRDLADASTILLPIGAALLGAGAFFYLTSRHSRTPEIRADVAPNGARVRLGWSW